METTFRIPQLYPSVQPAVCQVLHGLAHDMSLTAEQYAIACAHPKVKGSVRALLDQIAKEIPDGETSTAPMAIDDLATRAGYHEKSMRQARDTLAEIGLLRIVSGGRGRLASYELLALPGAGDDPSLPLLGIARPRTKPQELSRPNLFEQLDADVSESDGSEAEFRADNIGKKYRRCGKLLRNIGTFYRRLTLNIGTFYRRLIFRVYDIGKKYRRWPKTSVQDVGLGVDDARAREYVHTLKETHTHSAASPSEPSKPPPCVYAHAHAWCAGRVHVPKGLHQEFLGKMGRQGGESDRDKETRLTAFYVQTCAALPAAQPISDNDFKFWRRAFADTFGSGVAKVNTPRDAEPASGSICTHQPRCETWSACTERTLADGRGERQRKSG